MSRPAAVALLAVLASIWGVAWAAEPGSVFKERSARVQRVDYKENVVVEIAGYVNTPFVIEFHQDEPIGEVAVPDMAPYELVKKGTRLFVRPTAAPKAPVTMLVTSRTRSYVIDLVAGAPAKFKDRASKVVFTYLGVPAPARAVPVAAPPVAAAAAPPAAAPAAAELSAAGYRNDNYSLQVVSETVDVRPREAFDDGRFTYFKFPNNIEVPAIYKSTPGTNEEWLVNSHRDGDYRVMHGVAQLWNFRLAGTVLGIFNDSYEPDGVAPKNGTTVRGLDRRIKP